MESYYPDYNKILEIENRLQEIRYKLESSNYYNEEAYEKEEQLERELVKLTMGERVAVEKKFCKVMSCKGNVIYYPGKIHHLDGDVNNESFGNLAMVCPNCHAHILLSRYSPDDIWLLKVKGLNNAQIARYLGISRERVRQLCKKAQQLNKNNDLKELARIASIDHKTDEEEVKLKAGINELVRQAQNMEKYLRVRYSGDYDDDVLPPTKTQKQRFTDKRTLRKRILVELLKLG